MLNEFEQAHAASITDPNPTLIPTPPTARPRVLMASVLRKPPEVLVPFFAALLCQQVRHPGAELDFAFIPNYADTDAFGPAALDLIRRTWAPTQVREIPAPVGDYGDTARTRAWSPSSFTRMADLKNLLIQHAMDTKVDFLFLIDADVIIDPYTLQALLDNESPIVSALYWTNWQRAVEGATDFQHAGPQVWLRHPYHLNDERYSEAEFRERLINRARLRVRGLGACTLIHIDALRAGVNFSRVDNLPPGPMSEGEDRHFCARAARAHIPLYVDAWPDVYHAYHPAEYGELPQQAAALHNWPHFQKPGLGNLVSVKLELLEPVADQLGRQMMIAPKLLRGRLGALPTLPQIEEAVANLEVGASAVIRIHFPGHYELGWLRGQTRIMRVTLLDCKAFWYAPVIDRELLVGSALGRFVDSTGLTGAQVAELVETGTEVSV